MSKDPKVHEETVFGSNRKAFHEYHVDDQFEFGIELVGTEVKSIRLHHFNFSDAWVDLKDDELWLKGMQINPYTHGNLNNHEALRPRKLLAHKAEIAKLRRKVDERGFTLIPLDLHKKQGLIKIRVGLCKGKKAYDKRDDIKKRDVTRDMAREARER